MKRGLGRGLSQLLGDEQDKGGVIIPVDQIVPNPRQPRRHFEEDALDDLARSIRTHGVLQPLVVRQVGPNKYELIAGERRLRASKKAGLTEVPVIVRGANAQDSLELALIENVQREDIGPIECALAYRQLIEEYGLTQEQVAERVGKSRAGIANTLRLLGLPKTILTLVEERKLSEGHARAVLMAQSESRQLTLAKRIVEEGLTVRETERLARSEPRLPGPAKDPKPVRPADPNDTALERAIGEHLGTRVRIERTGKGGRLHIEFYGEDDLTRITDLIGIEL